MRLVAFYLPQYYPTETNNKWYGPGFTEWTNVASAKPLFKGHYEPHVPADLGFYDLRVQETRRAQANMAKEYGLEAFCYWTYWFGDGVQELDKPIWDVFEDKEIDFPFCLGWANASWEKKKWNSDASGNELILEQRYLGEEDYAKFFYKMLPLFKDSRYFKVDGRLFFIVHCPFDNQEEVKRFLSVWKKLSGKEGLPGFYFAAADHESRKKDVLLSMGFDAIYNMDTLNIHHHLNIVKKVILKIQRDYFKRPTVFKYKDAIKYMISEDSSEENVIPVIAPNWDHSPRSGRKSFILTDSDPKYFGKLLRLAKETVSKKSQDKQVVIIQSWNEWGEGNHLEPDQKYGIGYLKKIKDVLEE